MQALIIASLVVATLYGLSLMLEGKWRRRSAAALSLLLAVFVGLWGFAPDIVRWYVHGHYPGVLVGEVETRPWELDMVLWIDRDGVVASLPHVRVHIDGSVEVEGGTVVLSMREPGGGGTHRPSRQVSAKGLDLLVYRPEGTVVLHGVDVGVDRGARWASGSADVGLYGGAVASFGQGRVAPSLESAVVGEVVVRAPRLERFSGDVRVARVDVDDGMRHVVLRGVRLDHVEVGRADVRLSSDRTVRAEFTGTSISHRLLWDRPVVVPSPIVVLWEPSSRTLHLRSGAAQVLIYPDERRLVGPTLACQQWVDALPPDVRGPLEGLAFSGTLSWEISLGAKPDLVYRSTCKSSCGDDRFKALRSSFTYPAYLPDGKTRFDRRAGPATTDWVPMRDIREVLLDLVNLMEDPGFLCHNGVDPSALRNSLIDNLKTGRFHRGGSTIPMQLARNLWLGRDKNLLRKVQEMFLAHALNSCLSKADIVTLYLNVVEFGPNTYGIGPAARTMFDKRPSELLPEEAFFLISSLPRARFVARPNGATMDGVRRRMRSFVEAGVLREDWMPPDETTDIDQSGWRQDPSIRDP